MYQRLDSRLLTAVYGSVPSRSMKGAPAGPERPPKAVEVVRPFSLNQSLLYRMGMAKAIIADMDTMIVPAAYAMKSLVLVAANTVQEPMTCRTQEATKDPLGPAWLRVHTANRAEITFAMPFAKAKVFSAW